MQHPEKTYREICDIMRREGPICSALADCGIERVGKLGLLDVKKKDVPIITRYRILALLAFDALMLVGSLPGGQMAAFIFLSIIFFPVYYILTR